MAIIKCKMCGGDLAFEEGSTVCECEYCGSKQTLPNADNEKKVNLYNRANRLRRNNEFDKASAVYESIVAEFPEEAEAYWGLCLCAYGIEYVDDPVTGSKIPTCHRTMAESIVEDSNFEQACDNADAIARRVYRDEAKAIDRIQKEILSIAANESPYDVFICYKETNDAGGRTEDSVLAQEIYDALTAKDLKVFFSRITLEDKLGVQYEPYIYAALSSAKVMLAIGTDFENYDAVWVKNEWSRFLGMMKIDKTKTLIPCFKGLDAYDIPKEFKGLQAQDMGKLGWLQDLTRGVEKLCGKSADVQQTTNFVETANTAVNPTVASLLERTEMFLADGNWDSADSYCEKVLDIEPKNAMAYFYKLMVELRVNKADDLKNNPQPFDEKNNYQKIMHFGDEALKEKLEADIQFINDRNDYEKVQHEKAVNKDGDEVLRLAELLPDLKNIKSGDSLQVLEQKLEKLKDIVSVFPSVAAENSDLQAQKRGVEQELTDLSNARSKLGFFAGKEKKAADAKISEKQSELASLYSKISDCRTKLGGYTSVEQVNEQIKKLEGKIVEKKAITEKVKDIPSYEAACKRIAELCKSFEVSIKVLKKAPSEKVLISLTKEIEIPIIFGSYPHTNGGKMAPIEWNVLDVRDRKLLVISKYGLDARPYNSERKKVTWEACTLRSWLNNDFYNMAFNDEEKNVIIQTNVTADRNPKYDTFPGNNTTDNVFLLSIPEAEKYFSGNNARMCVPTEYAKSHGTFVSDSFKTASGEATCWWWLRSPGLDQYNAALVYSVGAVYYFGDYVHNAYACVRPALWINLES